MLAFMFGAVAALAQATVPYYTGQVIDYASIDPDRCVHVYLLGSYLFPGLVKTQQQLHKIGHGQEPSAVAASSAWCLAGSAQGTIPKEAK